MCVRMASDRIAGKVLLLGCTCVWMTLHMSVWERVSVCMCVSAHVLSRSFVFTLTSNRGKHPEGERNQH